MGDEFTTLLLLFAPCGAQCAPVLGVPNLVERDNISLLLWSFGFKKEKAV